MLSGVESLLKTLQRQTGTMQVIFEHDDLEITMWQSSNNCVLHISVFPSISFIAQIVLVFVFPFSKNNTARLLGQIIS